MNPPVVLGIAGGSGAGKTTVLNHILREVGADPIAILEHDAYYRDLSPLSPKERARFNFDHPDALETQLMREHLDQLLGGEPIEKPVYDFTTHTRREKTETIEPRPVIIIEGILRQYERTVRPMHLEFVEPSKREADIIIPRGGHNQVAIQMVMSRIQELLRSVGEGTAR